MALINCPECGKENVSDNAEMCPGCGYGVKVHFEKIAKEEQNKKLEEERQRRLDEAKKARLDSITAPDKPKIPIVATVCVILSWILVIKLATYNENPFVSFIFMSMIPGLFTCALISYYNDKIKKYDLAMKNLDKYKQQIIIEQDEAFERYQATQANKIKCPNCGSNSTSSISTLNRAASVATVGLASSKIGKTMQCKNCGYKW